MEYDKHRNVLITSALAWGAWSGTADINGAAINTALYDACEFVVKTDTLGTGGTVTPTFEGSANGSTGWTPLASDSVIGTVITITAAMDDTIYRYGIVNPHSQYVRLVLDVSGTISGFGINAFALQTYGHVPIADQSV